MTFFSRQNDFYFVCVSFFLVSFFSWLLAYSISFSDGATIEIVVVALFYILFDDDAFSFNTKKKTKQKTARLFNELTGVSAGGQWPQESDPSLSLYKIAPPALIWNSEFPKSKRAPDISLLLDGPFVTMLPYKKKRKKNEEKCW